MPLRLAYEKFPALVAKICPTIHAINLTPDHPRFFKLLRNSRQCVSASLKETLTPRISCLPSVSVPMAVNTEQLTTEPWNEVG